MEIQYIRLEYNPKQLYKFHFADLDEPLNQFGWKVLIPASILWILVVATLRVISTTSQSRTVTFSFAGVVVLVVVVISTALESAKKKKMNFVHAQAGTPDFAVPSLPSEIATINVSNQGGDRG